MGIVNFGAPESQVDFLKSELGLDVFVEGGTYKGGTTKKMSNSFRKVFTIEKSNAMYEIANENLRNISNITLLKGDTREHLEKILEDNDNILFWLDAHWSGGETYGEDDECPLIEELQIIFQCARNYVILIDDARLFLAPPPYPHRIENWPSLKDIMNVLPMNKEITVFEDVIYIYSVNESKRIKLFIQEEVSKKWQKIRKKNKNSFVNVIKYILKRFLN